MRARLSLLAVLAGFSTWSYANLSVQVTAGRVYYLPPLGLEKTLVKKGPEQALSSEGTLEIQEGASVQLQRPDGTRIHIRTPGLFPLSELEIRDLELEKYVLKSAVTAKAEEMADVKVKPDLFFRQGFLRRMIAMVHPDRMAELPKREQDPKAGGIDYGKPLKKIEIIYPPPNSSFPLNRQNYLSIYFAKDGAKRTRSEELEIFLWQDGTVRSQPLGSTTGGQFSLAHPNQPGVYYLQIVSKDLQAQSDRLRLHFSSSTTPSSEENVALAAPRDRPEEELVVLSPSSGEIFVSASDGLIEVPMVIAKEKERQRLCSYGFKLLRGGQTSPARSQTFKGTEVWMTLEPGIYLAKVQRNCSRRSELSTSETQISFRVARKKELADLTFAGLENRVTFMP